MNHPTAFVLVGSTSRPLTSEPVSLELADIDPTAMPGGNWLVRVFGDSDFHLRSDGADATQFDYPCRAGLAGILVSVAPASKISAVKKSGAADSTIWFSRVKRI
jgi:hypothetical protein